MVKNYTVKADQFLVFWGPWLRIWWMDWMGPLEIHHRLRPLAIVRFVWGVFLEITLKKISLLNRHHGPWGSPTLIPEAQDKDLFGAEVHSRNFFLFPLQCSRMFVLDVPVQAEECLGLHKVAVNKSTVGHLGSSQILVLRLLDWGCTEGNGCRCSGSCTWSGCLPCTALVWWGLPWELVELIGW